MPHHHRKKHPEHQQRAPRRPKRSERGAYASAISKLQSSSNRRQQHWPKLAKWVERFKNVIMACNITANALRGKRGVRHLPVPTRLSVNIIGSLQHGLSSRRFESFNVRVVGACGIPLRAQGRSKFLWGRLGWPFHAFFRTARVRPRAWVHVDAAGHAVKQKKSGDSLGRHIRSRQGPPVVAHFHLAGSGKMCKPDL